MYSATKPCKDFLMFNKNPISPFCLHVGSGLDLFGWAKEKRQLIIKIIYTFISFRGQAATLNLAEISF